MIVALQIWDDGTEQWRHWRISTLARLRADNREDGWTIAQLGQLESGLPFVEVEYHQRVMQVWPVPASYARAL